MNKTCTSCRVEKPATTEFFTPQKRGKNGLTATCKECRAATSNSYHAVKPNSRRAAQLKRKFGMTLVEYDALFTAQGGMCAICCTHQNALPKRLAVDHCHTTGKIRALLCQQCNQGIGMLKENPAIMFRAIEYVNLHNTHTGAYYNLKNPYRGI